MKKKLIRLTAMISLLAMGGVALAQDIQERTIRFGHLNNTGHPTSTGVLKFAELVEEGLRAFNVERIHAGDLTTGDRLADGVASIIAAVRTLPMMVPRRVVEGHGRQDELRAALLHR